jgi:hypothetical protein
MKRSAVLALFFGVSCAAFGQDDALQTRRFQAGFLTSYRTVMYSESLSLYQDAIGVQVSAGENVNGGPVSGEELVALLRQDSPAGTWDEPGTSIEFRDGQLLAVHRRSVLDAVGAWLARARARYARRVAVDAALVLVPFDRWGRLKPAELPGASKTLKSARVFMAPGETGYLRDVVQRSYVRDHDVQISTSAAALDPVVDVLSTGVRIELRALPGPSEEAVLLDVRADAADFEGLDDRLLKLVKLEPATEPVPLQAGGAVPPAPAILAKDWEGLVQLPRTTLDRFRGQALAKPGETVVAFAARRADGVLALLLTPSIVREAVEEDAPAGAFTRLYDVRAITAKIQDWAGPRPGLASPTAGGAGPLTGATFTLDEPREGFGEETLADEVRPLAGEKSFEKTSGEAFQIRATAEKHAAVQKRLAEVFRREVRTLTTDIAVLAFKPGARAAWAAKVPALAPGGSRATAEAFAPLLAAEDVRVAAMLQLTGRPNQRIHLVSGRQQAYIQDFEPQVSTSSAVFDPIIGVQLSGVGADVTPTPRADDGSVDLRLRVWMLTVEMAEEKKVSSGGGPVQRPKLSGPSWEAEVVCLPGHWTLAALESRGEEDVALFVRVNDNAAR